MADSLRADGATPSLVPPEQTEEPTSTNLRRRLDSLRSEEEASGIHQFDVPSGWRHKVGEFPPEDTEAWLHPRLRSEEDELITAVRRSLEVVDDEPQEFDVAIPRPPKAPEDLKKHVRQLEREEKQEQPRKSDLLESFEEERQSARSREDRITLLLGASTLLLTVTAVLLAWQLFAG